MPDPPRPMRRLERAQVSLDRDKTEEGQQRISDRETESGGRQFEGVFMNFKNISMRKSEDLSSRARHHALIGVARQRNVERAPLAGRRFARDRATHRLNAVRN